MPIDAEDVKAALTGRFADFYGRFTPLKPLGGEMRGPCPLHGGTGQNFAVNPDTGLWNCFSGCQDGGDAFRFLEKLEGVSFPEALERVAAFAGVSGDVSSVPAPIRRAQALPAADPVFLDSGLAEAQHERLMKLDSMRQWLSEYRGLSTETLVNFRLGMQKDEQGLFRVTFPVYDAESRLLNIRRHLFAYKEGLDRTFKTLPWEKGLTAGLFPMSALNGQTEVLLVEGEADALLANQMGFPAVTGTLGAGNWKDHWTEALRGCQRVTILYDGDKAGRDGAQKAAAALSAAVPNIRIASLPDGEDFTSWVIGKGATAADVQKAIEAAAPFLLKPEPAAVPLPARKALAERLVDMADIGPPPTDLPLLWWVFTEKMTHWLSAPSGAGKTTLAFNIVTALAEGTDLWGRVTRRPVRTVYVDRESGQIVQQTKLEKLYQGAPRVRGGLLFLDDIQLPTEMPDLVSFCQSRSVDLVVFDTAAKTWNLRDENDNAEIGRSITPVLETLKSAGVASLVIDHTGKNGSGARGASAKSANVDVVLDVDVRGEGEHAVVSVNCSKHKLLGFPPPLMLKRIGSDQFENVDADASGMEEETASKQMQCRQFILDTLGDADAPITHGGLMKRATADGIKKSTFSSVWRSMKSEQEVRTEGDGYVLTDPFAE